MKNKIYNLDNKKKTILVIVIVCLFIYFYHIKNINKLQENFKNNFNKKQREHFISQNDIPSIKKVGNVNNLKNNKNNVTNKLNNNLNNNLNNGSNNLNNGSNNLNNGSNNLNNGNNNLNNGNNNLNNEKNNFIEEKCPIAEKQNDTDDNCLFGCEKKEVQEEKPKELSLEEMMRTIEETEQLCNMIDEKDSIRREREEIENINKQLELNKKFLIQQKSQNKQIDDLQEIIKSMVFTDEMNKVAVEKCSGRTDECLTDKESQLNRIYKEKLEKDKKLKVNLNMKNFNDDLKAQLMAKLGASAEELARLLELVESGAINLGDLNRQSSSNLSNNKPCANCKIDLSKYIDRCKIPCHKCKDPAWGCPKNN